MMSSDPVLCRLLDSGWVVHLSRAVDGSYYAMARRRGQSPRDVMPQVGVNPVDSTKLMDISRGIPRQNAYGTTPTQALMRLADSVFGLQQSGDAAERKTDERND